MNINALIPVKTLPFSKTRLSSVLPLQMRQKLVLSMLTHVIKTLQQSELFNEITVVSADLSILRHAKDSGINTATEVTHELNSSLEEQAKLLRDDAKTPLLTIASDLPFITVNDITQLIHLANVNQIVLAPAKDNGTNALITKPLYSIPFQYGKDSFTRHSNSAEDKKLQIGIYRSETMEMDIDTPSDYALLLEKIG